ncbi:MAG TPA: hypothetical protein VNV44_11340 [Solirubrobacteraceae bacterium]|nr:hypothetical protein [Solirubrobacteraceae bacterium]
MALAAVLALCGGGQAAAHRPRRRHKPVPPPLCEPETSPYKSRAEPYRRTLATDDLAQVYSLGASRPALAGLQSGRRPIYGCVYSHRGALLLGAEPWDNGGKYMALNIGGERNVVIAGTFVAFEDYEMTESLCGFKFKVVVEDLRTGKVLRNEPAGTRTVPDPGFECGEVGLGNTTGIVLKADGAVAWILEPQDWAVEAHIIEPGYEVHAADATGSTSLARGLDVDPSSLALAGSTVYWTQGGLPRAATLH